MEINSALMYFRSRQMLCFDDEKHTDKNTFKDNCQSEYFIYQCYCFLLKFLSSVFKNLHVEHFILCHIPHPNRIKRFSNYQGKTLIALLYHIIFFLTFSLSLYLKCGLEYESRDQLTWVTKALVWMHWCFWLIIIKENSDDKSLLKIVK